jgi:hypothetical protein
VTEEIADEYRIACRRATVVANAARIECTVVGI